MRKIFFWSAVLAALAWSLGPFLWQFLTSIKPAEEIFQSPLRYWPSHASLQSYSAIFKSRPFALYMANSLWISLGATALALAVGAPAAYACARFSSKISGWVMGAALTIAIFPSTLLVIPLHRTLQMLHLTNNRFGLILCYATLNLPLVLWMMNHAFRQIPKELEEAALLDGMSRFKILLHIFFPLAAPALLSCAILIFIFSWNEFLLALTFLSSDHLRTVPVGIAMLTGASSYEVPWNQVTAAVVLTTLPVVAAVFMFQKRIVEGLTSGAVKG